MSQSTFILETTRIVASKQQVSCQFGHEAAILSLQNETYYGLDLVGAHVWTLIQKPMTVEEIRNQLLIEFEVEPDQCKRDLLNLLEKLGAEGLIEITNDRGS